MKKTCSDTAPNRQGNEAGKRSLTSPKLYHIWRKEIMAQVILKDGKVKKWAIRFRYNGKQIFVSDPRKVGFEEEYWSANITKKQMMKLAPIVEDRYAKIQATIEAQGLNERESTDEMLTQYLDTIAPRLKRQSFNNKRYCVDKYFRKWFDVRQKPSLAFTTESVRAFKNRLSNDADTKSSAKNHTLQLLRDFLRWLSIEKNMISMSDVERFRYILEPVSSSGEVRVRKDDFWTPSEWDAFIATFDECDTQYKLLFETCYWCALRLGELQALRYDCFDFDRKTCTITESEDASHYITAPKTKSSSNTINVRSDLIEEIKERKEETNALESEKIFDVPRTTIRRYFDKHIGMANIKKIKIHGLRRSMASRMINKGMNILMVSKQLRHDSPETTMKAYASLFPETDRGELDNI